MGKCSYRQNGTAERKKKNALYSVRKSLCNISFSLTGKNNFKEEFMSIRSEIKANIIRAGFTMQEVVDKLTTDYGWSDSVSNFSGKLSRESLRYKEAVELADALGYEIVWQKRTK